jgi:hypothetical protein
MLRTGFPNLIENSATHLATTFLRPPFPWRTIWTVAASQMPELLSIGLSFSIRVFSSRSDEVLTSGVAIVVNLADIEPWFVQGRPCNSHRIVWNIWLIPCSRSRA